MKRPDMMMAHENSSAALSVPPLHPLHPRATVQETVAFGEQLAGLCARIADGFGASTDVLLTCRACDAPVPRLMAVQLGMVADELITDAFTYGFRGRRGGRIAASFRVSDTAFALMVEHSGIAPGSRGFPPPRLARMLVARMGGQLDRPVTVGGTRYIVTIPRG